MGRIASRIAHLAHAWNAFNDREPESPTSRLFDHGQSFGARPDRGRFTLSNERSIISSIYTRIAIDTAAYDIRHVRLDEDERFVENIKSGINNCLTVEANIDQGARHFKQDIVQTLCDRGTIAIVPVETTLNPKDTSGYDITNMRVGEVVQWMPKKVKVAVYNEETGRREEVTLDKKVVAVVENPLFPVMNEPNSTLQRLIRKLNLLDAVDEQSSSGKLDMIIQLPYVIKSEARRQQADQRRKDIEMQLKGSQYGIAYTDGTEKITQLNRPAENNLLKQIEYLVALLYSQLGLTEAIMNGTADEAAMLNYHNRTVEPLLVAVTEAMHRSFLTKTARTQGQAIRAFREPFKFVPMKDLAELGDKLTRNEIVSSNEFRQFIGMKPSKDPKADELRNSNMPRPEDLAPPPAAEPVVEDTSDVDDAFAGVNAVLDDVFKDLGVEG